MEKSHIGRYGVLVGQENGDILNFAARGGDLVRFVCLVCLVRLVCLVQRTK